jgi:3-oxoacyl-[acyl-carrier-protein] synthase III
MSALVSSVAHFVPPTTARNSDLAGRLGVTADWIVRRTGIHERRIAESGGTSDLIVPAASECLRRAGVPATDVNCVIVATITPDHLTPATAVTVIGRLGATNAWGFDLSAACSGFLYGLATAASLVESGAARRVLVCAADRMSSITDPDDLRTAALLADGAGAALVERNDDQTLGLIDYLLRVDASGEQAVVVPAGGSALPATDQTVRDRKHYLFLAGQQVFRAAVEGMTAITAELMARNGLKPEDIDWLIPHQANLRIIEAVADRLQVPRERVAVNIDRYGNTSAATIPIVLSEWWQAGRLRKGQRIVMCSIGAGYTFAALYLRWTATELEPSGLQFQHHVL